MLWQCVSPLALRTSFPLAYAALCELADGHWPNGHSPTWRPDIVSRLPPHLAARFGHWVEKLREEKTVVYDAVRAVAARDAERFRSALDSLNPNPRTQPSCLSLLRVYATAAAGGRSVGRDLDEAERERVATGFAALDAASKTPEAEYRHGFHNKEPQPYEYYELPRTQGGGLWTAEAFVRSWGGAAEGGARL